MIYKPHASTCLLMLAASVFLLGAKGCGQGERLPAQPAAPSRKARSEGTVAAHANGILFREVAAASGIHYRWQIAGTRPLSILQTIGNGCALLDYDNDGNLDILLVGPQLALYKGDGQGHFMDVTHATGLDKLSGHFLGCAVGDYDNDGYEDIYLSAYRGGLLLHNNQGRHFSDVTKDAGIKPQPWGTSCTFTDMDGDGKLDLYICNYVQFGPNTQPQLCNYSTLMGACGPRFYKPERGVFYHNLGNGKFMDMTETWGAQNVSGKALGVAAAFLDASHHPTLALTNDEVAGDMLQNADNKARIKLLNTGVMSGTAYDSAGNVHGGMGVDWGDYDNDGKLDMVVATFQHEPKSLYHNDGKGLFTESSLAAGLADPTMSNVTFGIKFVDVDNDGFLDLLLANGHVQDNIAAIDKSTSYQQPIQLFHNVNGIKFQEISATSGAVFKKRIVGRGLAIGDFDNDGKMDALIVDSEGTPLLLHNETPVVGHWLLCRLTGTKSNHDGIGAMIEVEAGGRKLLRHCATDGSYLSASDRRVHFGLGAADKATVTVHWPSGASDKFRNVLVDRVITLREGKSTPSQ